MIDMSLMRGVWVDPVSRIVAMVRADFEPAICNRRTLTLWHAFWGEANARPLFAAIAEAYDRERAAALRAQTALGHIAEEYLTDRNWARLEQRMHRALASASSGS